MIKHPLIAEKNLLKILGIKINVIFNYGVLSTGFDAPNTNTVMIVRPTASPIMYSQMLGRGLRGPEVNGNEECWLIDLKDNLKGLR